MNWSAVPEDEVPLFVVTKMLSTVAACAGATAEISESDTMVKLVAAVELNLTAVAPVNPVPVMMTVWPPTVEPVLGETPVTVGVGAVKFV